MKGKSFSTELRHHVLKSVEAGGNIHDICRENQIAEQTLRRWLRQQGRMKVNEIQLRQEQEQKNRELKEILVNSLLMNPVFPTLFTREQPLTGWEVNQLK